MLALLAFVTMGCHETVETPFAAEPPLGEWRLVAVDGTIEIRQGGGPVICRQGQAQGRPAPLYDAARRGPDGQAPSRLWLEPERFLFTVAFDEGSYSHRFTNVGYGGNSFRGRWFESLSELRTEASWHWSESAPGGEVHGSVTTGSAPDDWRPKLGGRPKQSAEILDEPWITFEMAGRFVNASEIQGTWEYHERTRLGGCWSHGEGSGTWAATAPEPDQPASETLQ